MGKKTEGMDPADAPFAVTSEVPEIVEFLKKSGPKVIFCTYQPSELIAEAQLPSKIYTNLGTPNKDLSTSYPL